MKITTLIFYLWYVIVFSFSCLSTLASVIGENIVYHFLNFLMTIVTPCFANTYSSTCPHFSIVFSYFSPYLFLFYAYLYYFLVSDPNFWIWSQPSSNWGPDPSMPLDLIFMIVRFDLFLFQMLFFDILNFFMILWIILQNLQNQYLSVPPIDSRFLVFKKSWTSKFCFHIVPQNHIFYFNLFFGDFSELI